MLKQNGHELLIILPPNGGVFVCGQGNIFMCVQIKKCREHFDDYCVCGTFERKGGDSNP